MIFGFDQPDEKDWEKSGLNIDRDLRNRALLPFQSLTRKISNAPHILLINQLADDASNEIDRTLPVLE